MGWKFGRGKECVYPPNKGRIDRRWIFVLFLCFFVVCFPLSAVCGGCLWRRRRRGCLCLELLLLLLRRVCC